MRRSSETKQNIFHLIFLLSSISPTSAVNGELTFHRVTASLSHMQGHGRKRRTLKGKLCIFSPNEAQVRNEDGKRKDKDGTHLVYTSMISFTASEINNELMRPEQRRKRQRETSEAEPRWKSFPHEEVTQRHMHILTDKKGNIKPHTGSSRQLCQCRIKPKWLLRIKSH